MPGALFGRALSLRAPKHLRAVAACLRAAAACLIALPLPGSAGALGELLAAARLHDAEYLAARAQYAATVARLDQARAAFYPAVNLSANSMWNDQDIDILGQPVSREGQFNTNGYTLSVNQPLFKSLNDVQLAQARRGVRQAEAQYAAAEAALVNRVTQHFVEALQAQAAARASGAEVAYAAALNQAVSERYRRETATLAEQLESGSLMRRAAALELEASLNVRTRLLLLSHVAGREVPPGLISDYVVVLPRESPSLQDWTAQALAYSPAVRAYAEALELARLEVRRAETGNHPVLELVASHGRNKQGPTASQFFSSRVTNSAIGVQLAVPIFAGGVVQARKTEALALTEKAERELEAARRAAQYQVLATFQALQVSQQQYEAQQHAAAALEEVVFTTQKAVEGGTKTSFELLKARAQLEGARRDLGHAAANALLHRVRLQTLSGASLELLAPGPF